MSSANANIDLSDPDQSPDTPSATGISDLPLTSTQKVVSIFEILQNIIAHLDNGEPDDLVRCLPVSKAFFECAAHILCQRITVPDYEFTVSRARDPVIYEESCPSCRPDFPYIPPSIPGTTTHTPREKDPIHVSKSYENGHTDESGSSDNEDVTEYAIEDGGDVEDLHRQTGVACDQRERVEAKGDEHAEQNSQDAVGNIDSGTHEIDRTELTNESDDKDYELDEPSVFIKAMYRHVRVLNIEPHGRCAELSVLRPLPNVQTVIACGDFLLCDTNDTSTSSCGLSPAHPFRLVLDGLCMSLLCEDWTSPRLLTPNVETLVLRLRYDMGQDCCRTMDMLPIGCKPKRVVIMFPIERFRESIFPDDLDDENHRYWMRARPLPPMALSPADLEKAKGREERTSERSDNWFQRIARVCLLVPDSCEILIVGADQPAIYIRNLSAYDPSLPIDPEQPQPRSRPQALSSLRRHLERFPIPVEPYVSDYEQLWLSTSDIPYDTFGLVSLMDGSSTAGLDVDQQDESKVSTLDPFVHGPECNLYAVYGQSGRVVSARIKPGLIDNEQLPAATSLIQRRVAVIKSLIHTWIDEVFDRLPQFPWETEHLEWHDRRDFDRYYMYLKAIEKDEAEMDRTRALYKRLEEKARVSLYEIFNIHDMDPIIPAPLEVLDAWKEGLRFAPTKAELEARRVGKHRKVRFMTLHEYHRLEGNNDELDDPSMYL
jgi:hypothetical protein